MMRDPINQGLYQSQSYGPIMSRRLKPILRTAWNVSLIASSPTRKSDLDGWTSLTKDWLRGFKPSAISKISQRFVRDFLSPDTQYWATTVSQSATRKRHVNNGHVVPKTAIDLTDDAEEPVEFIENKRPQFVVRAPSGSADKAPRSPRRHLRLL
ncbi:hypothetical protein N7G274_009812 [Stereocaulon virgatum]|uniref:Uncharacterized protein n=1 Tax=Stereocaulon virgatum TaxID=373712 RepID=A0ABR3ZXT3_9LECA